MNVMFLEESLYDSLSEEDRDKLNSTSKKFDLIVLIKVDGTWVIGYNIEYQKFRTRKGLPTQERNLTREQASDEFQEYVAWKNSNVKT